MKNEIRPDYTTRYLFPPAVEDFLPPDHPARFIRAFVDSLDLKGLGFKEREVEVGHPSYSVDLLLKIWYYGYMTRIRSTRMLERACMDSVALIWLTGMNAPDHNTLWRFFRDNKKAFKEVCRMSVRVAMKSNLLGMMLHAVDGTKIRSAGSESKELRRKDLEEHLKRVEESVDEMMAEVESREATEKGEVRLPEELRDPVVLDRLIRDALSKLDEAEAGRMITTDPDARRMKSGDGFEFAYNAQAVVDSEIGLIVGEDVFCDGNDNHLLNEMLDEVEENVGGCADETVADAGYYSSTELAKAEGDEREVLVPIGEQQGGDGDGEFHASKFRYDPDEDCVYCPLGEKLVFRGMQKSRKGVPSKVFECRIADCPSRGKCTDCKTGRLIRIGKYHQAMVRQREKQRSPWAKGLMRRRKTIVEPVFGVIKEIMKLRRWDRVGVENVRAVWSIICTVYNLKKLHKYWVDGRLELSGGN